MSGQYTIDDVFGRPLPEKYRDVFFSRLFPYASVDLRLLDHMTVCFYVRAKLMSLHYKETVEFVLADTAKERAIAAFMAKVDPESVQVVVDAWTEVVGTMSDVERALEGL